MPSEASAPFLNGLSVAFAPAPSGASSHSMPSGRSGAAVVSRGHQNVYFGGLDDFENLLNEVAIYDTVDEKWIQPLITGEKPRASFGVGSVLLSDRTILIHGGQCFEQIPAPTLTILDLDAAKWIPQVVRCDEARRRLGPDPLSTFYRWGQTLIAVPAALYGDVLGTDAADARDVLLVMLGDTDQSQRDVLVLWRSQVQENVWYVFQRNSGPEWLVPRRRHVCALYKDEYVLMFGGRTMDRRNTICNADLWIYSISANIWVKIEHNTSAFLLHVFIDASALNVQDPRLRKHHIELQKFTAHAMRSNRVRDRAPQTAEPWPKERTGHIGFVRGDKFWIATGFRPATKAVQTFNDVWCFDLGTATWTNVQKFDTTDQITVPLPSRPPESGFRPNSMSTIAPLPAAAAGTFLYFGGRLKERALQDIGVVTFSQPTSPTLASLTRRHILLCAIRSAFLSSTTAIVDVDYVSNFVTRFNEDLPQQLQLVVDPLETESNVTMRRRNHRVPGEIG